MGENRIRRAREMAGLSVAQAAKLIGVSRGMVDHIERMNAGEITRAYARRFAELYDVSLEWMLGEVPRLDLEAVRHLRGAEKIEMRGRDRDDIAELLASRPRRTR